MSVQRNKITTFARGLRHHLTDTERFVWAKLRGRRFAGYKFRRQKPIHSYIVDFVCIEHRLIIELDGSQHLEQVEYDERRTECLQGLGFTVLRFWNHIALTDWDTVEEYIWQNLQQAPSQFALAKLQATLDHEMESHSTPLTPYPSPQRGEGN